MRTRQKSPGQNSPREFDFGSLKYERLYLNEVTDGLDLAEHGQELGIGYNTIRPHEAMAWNNHREIHLGSIYPSTPNFSELEILPTS